MYIIPSLMQLSLLAALPAKIAAIPVMSPFPPSETGTQGAAVTLMKAVVTPLVESRTALTPTNGITNTTLVPQVTVESGGNPSGGGAKNSTGGPQPICSDTFEGDCSGGDDSDGDTNGDDDDDDDDDSESPSDCTLGQEFPNDGPAIQTLDGWSGNGTANVTSSALTNRTILGDSLAVEIFFPDGGSYVLQSWVKVRPGIAYSLKYTSTIRPLSHDLMACWVRAAFGAQDIALIPNAEPGASVALLASPFPWAPGPYLWGPFSVGPFEAVTASQSTGPLPLPGPPGPPTSSPPPPTNASMSMYPDGVNQYARFILFTGCLYTATVDYFDFSLLPIGNNEECGGIGALSNLTRPA